jgi:ribosomal protein L22
MEAKAVARYLRQSPRKMRLIADLIRGEDVNAAYATL